MLLTDEYCVSSLFDLASTLMLTAVSMLKPLLSRVGRLYKQLSRHAAVSA